MVLDEVTAALSIWDRLKKWWDVKKNPPAESVATRLVRLFESHGVHRNQIPRFIGHGLTLKDVQNDASLLEKLDESLLDAACARFAVRREWLDGAEPQIHRCHDFYTRPERFSEFLGKLLSSNPQGRMIGVVLAPEDSAERAEALIILQEIVGTVGDKAIYRYHVLYNWAFSYWKARAYLTACIAIAWKREVYLHGVSKARKDIEQLAQGKILLGWQGEGIWEFGNKTWDPEDMALQPEAFLKGVDPERDNFGIKSALTLWLNLEQQGLMDAGFKGKDARQLFEKELAKQTSAVDG